LTMDNLPRRKKTRLEDFDYSTPGAYFITICTQNRRNILSNIVGDGFPVSKMSGKIAERFIKMISVKYPKARVDKYVIMPNHIHMILEMEKDLGETGNPSPTMGTIIGWYKYQVSTHINLAKGTAGQRVFQRSYYDHVIRNQQDYNEIWQYIDSNPAKWQEDCFYNEAEENL